MVVWASRVHWLAVASAVVSAVSADHPALGSLGMGGDLRGRAHARATKRARRRSGASAPSMDQCDPHAVALTAVAADPLSPIAINSTVFAQWAWSADGAARAPPLATDWVGLYCSRSAPALRSMSSASLARWNLFNITYKAASGGLVGRVGFAIPAIAAWGWGGTCEFRYFTHRDGSSYCLASSQATPFVVEGMPNEGAAMPVTLAADHASILVGQQLRVSYAWSSAGVAAANDWVGIYCAADAVALLDVPDDAICETGCEVLWQYVDADPHWSAQKGSIPITVPPSRYGVCEVRYFSRAGSNAYDHQGTSSTTFTVSNAGVQWGTVEMRIHPDGPVALGTGVELTWAWKGTGAATAWVRGAAPAPAASDVIALYCGDSTATSGADTEPFGGTGLAAAPDHKYLDYALASTLDKRQWSTGQGNFSRPLGSTARLPLCEFRMFRADDDADADGADVGAWAGPSSPLAWLGSSPPFEVAGYGGPQQLHLALTGNRDEMRVHWTSGSAAPGAVRWWLAAAGGGGGGAATGSAHTYTAADMCNFPANDPHDFHDPGMLHEAVMTGLQPGQVYNYSVGDDETGWSPMRSFTAAPPAVQKGGKGGFDPFTYIVYADMGVGVPGRWGQCAGSFGQAPGCFGSPTDKWPHSVKVLVEHEVRANGARMVHHFGDISYAVGNSATWEAFFALIAPIAERCPYMVGVGNHEMCHSGGGSRDPSAPGDPAAVNAAGAGYCAGVYTDDSLGECGVPMNARFTMPGNGNGVFWYSYDFSAVKTIMLSSHHQLQPGSVQHSWLAAQLAAVDRDVTPWVVVELHRPMYNNEDYMADYDTGMRIRAGLEPLLLAHGVDLVLAGHYHAYLRSSRIVNDTVPAPGSPGIYHFTIGTAGALLDSAGVVAPKEWRLHFEATYGYGRITVANSTHMLWEYIRASDSNASAVTPTPFVADSVWITKPGV